MIAPSNGRNPIFILMRLFNPNKDLFNNMKKHSEDYNIEISDSDVTVYNGINEPKRYNKNDFIMMLFEEAEISTKIINFI